MSHLLQVILRGMVTSLRVNLHVATRVQDIINICYFSPIKFSLKTIFLIFWREHLDHVIGYNFFLFSCESPTARLAPQNIFLLPGEWSRHPPTCVTDILMAHVQVLLFTPFLLFKSLISLYIYFILLFIFYSEVKIQSLSP